MFAKQSVDAWVKWHVEQGDGTEEELRKMARDAIARKKGGQMCDVCESIPIWAAVDAIAETGMCFHCTTGEADDSDDFEFEEVC
jgi:hypothetical protein